MADVADLLQYRHFRNTAFAFVTAPAPTDTSPKYVAGSNLMTSYKGYTEQRPGFDVGLETTPTTFTDPIVRTFCWRRWGAGFYIMLSTVGTVAKVWKLAIGVDASFVNIWTSVSAEPFDFVVSNNFCFFGNGTDMKKFDGTNIWNWGIAIGSINTTSASYAGTGTSTAGPSANPWVNPTNFQGAPDGSFSTCSFTTPSHSTRYTDNLNGTNFTFVPSLSPAAAILGIQVAITGLVSGGNPAPQIQLQKGGVLIGSPKTFALGSSVSTVVLGSSSDLWGATLSASILNDPTFGVQVFVGDTNRGATSQTVNASMDAVQITVFDLGGPMVAVNPGVGTFSASNGGYAYVFCYENSTTGHVSSPTQPSASTGNFTNKLEVDITLTASMDPQVTNIRVFRTTDGGGGVFFEVQNSPYPNVSGTVADNTSDANLSIITAPTFGFNDPPPPQMGLVWFANRIWGFKNATVYFTDWEEMNIGVPEEGSVSGPSGNFWNFASEVTGLSVAQDGVLIFTAGQIFKIAGDSLSTFTRITVADKLGCRNRATITRLGGMTAFLANTNSIWTTDSTSLNEISQMIQPTLDNIDHSQASMSFHLQGQYRWLLLGDQGHSQTLAFDVNTQQWMPPWTIVGQGLSSGETSPGNWTLLLGQQGSNKMLQMIPNQYTDNGATYAMGGTTNLLPLTNEHLSSGSPIIDLFYPQAPEHVAQMEYAAFEFNAQIPTTVKRMFDDDPATAAYVDITPNVKDSPLKTVVQGANILDKWYYDRAWSGKRVSIQFSYAASPVNKKIYTMTIAYKQVR